ncbi:MAG TPA: hypothetical protein VFF73_30850 [Planctomycetota bacterium]|nr:hypothetical protein [Planctomycetota bacterium]
MKKDARDSGRDDGAAADARGSRSMAFLLVPPFVVVVLWTAYVLVVKAFVVRPSLGEHDFMLGLAFMGMVLLTAVVGVAWLLQVGVCLGGLAWRRVFGRLSSGP